MTWVAADSLPDEELSVVLTEPSLDRVRSFRRFLCCRSGATSLVYFSDAGWAS